MNPKAPRIAALVAAPLLVVGATALVLLPRGGDGPPPPSPDGPKVTILKPAQGDILALERLQVVARAEDPDGIAYAELRVNGDKVASELTSGGSSAMLDFGWTPKEKGDATVVVRARDAGNRWGEAVITVSLGTGLPPLPPPPTTAFPTTLPTGPTTTAASTTVSTDPDRTTVPTVPPTGPPTVAPTAPPTVAPTAPPTPPPTEPPTTLPPTTEPPTTPPTTEPPTTEPPTTPPTTVTPAAQPEPCRIEAPQLLSPADGATGVSTQPVFSWASTGSCPPAGQRLWAVAPGGAGGSVQLDGTARSASLSAPLPSCTRVRWGVTSLDGSGRPRAARWFDFTTAC